MPFAAIRPARQPHPPHTAPHIGTRLLHASAAHLDVLYLGLETAGVPLFKADRGSPTANRRGKRYLPAAFTIDYQVHFTRGT